MDGELIVAPYQGSIACLVLKRHTGVCWAAINKKEIIIVDDVTKFPDHIACDNRSKSEIVIPIYDKKQNLVAVMDVDSRELNSFDEADSDGLQKICKLIYE